MKYEEFVKEVARLSGGKDCSVATRLKFKGKYVDEYTEEEQKELDFEGLRPSVSIDDFDYEIIGVHVYNEDFSNALDNPLLAREDCIHIEMRSSKRQQFD